MRTTIALALVVIPWVRAGDALSSIPIPTPTPLAAPPLKLTPTKTTITPPIRDREPSFSKSPQVEEVLGLIDLFGSVDRYRNAVTATRIEVVKLKGQSELAVDPADYSEGAPVPISDSEANQLKRALLTDSSYLWGEDEICDCVPQYDFRVRFLSSDAVVTCDVAVSEKILRVLDGKREIAAAPFSRSSDHVLVMLDRKRG